MLLNLITSNKRNIEYLASETTLAGKFESSFIVFEQVCSEARELLYKFLSQTCR